MVEEPGGVLLNIVNECISECVSNSGEKPTMEAMASPCLLYSVLQKGQLVLRLLPGASA